MKRIRPIMYGILYGFITALPPLFVCLNSPQVSKFIEGWYFRVLSLIFAPILLAITILFPVLNLPALLLWNAVGPLPTLLLSMCFWGVVSFFLYQYLNEPMSKKHRIILELYMGFCLIIGLLYFLSLPLTKMNCSMIPHELHSD